MEDLTCPDFLSTSGKQSENCWLLWQVYLPAHFSACFRHRMLWKKQPAQRALPVRSLCACSAFSFSPSSGGPGRFCRTGSRRWFKCWHWSRLRAFPFKPPFWVTRIPLSGSSRVRSVFRLPFPRQDCSSASLSFLFAAFPRRSAVRCLRCCLPEQSVRRFCPAQRQKQSSVRPSQTVSQIRSAMRPEVKPAAGCFWHPMSALPVSRLPS